MLGSQCIHVVILYMNCALQVSFRESHKKLISIIQWYLVIFRIRSMCSGNVYNKGYKTKQ